MKLSIPVSVPVFQMVGLLKDGLYLWGGGFGVRKVSSWKKFVAKEDHAKLMEISSEFEVHGPTEEGGTYTKIHGDAFEAVWDYLRHVGGNAIVTAEFIEE